MIGKNRIMIYGRKRDGTYVVELRTAGGDTLTDQRASWGDRVLKHFQERMLSFLEVFEQPPTTLIRLEHFITKAGLHAVAGLRHQFSPAQHQPCLPFLHRTPPAALACRWSYRGRFGAQLPR
jgi:hypothetical protein